MTFVDAAIVQVSKPLSEVDPVIVDGKVSWEAVNRRRSPLQFTDKEGETLVRVLNEIEQEVDDFLASPDGLAGLDLLHLTNETIVLDQLVCQTDVGIWRILGETFLSGNGLCRTDYRGIHPISTREAVQAALRGYRVTGGRRTGYSVTGGRRKKTIENLDGFVDFLKKELEEIAKTFLPA